MYNGNVYWYSVSLEMATSCHAKQVFKTSFTCVRREREVEAARPHSSKQPKLMHSLESCNHYVAPTAKKNNGVLCHGHGLKIPPELKHNDRKK